MPKQTLWFVCAICLELKRKEVCNKCAKGLAFLAFDPARMTRATRYMIANPSGPKPEPQRGMAAHRVAHDEQQILEALVTPLNRGDLRKLLRCGNTHLSVLLQSMKERKLIKRVRLGKRRGRRCGGWIKCNSLVL